MARGEVEMRGELDLPHLLEPRRLLRRRHRREVVLLLWLLFKRLLIPTCRALEVARLEEPVAILAVFRHLGELLVGRQLIEILPTRKVD